MIELLYCQSFIEHKTAQMFLHCAASVLTFAAALRGSLGSAWKLFKLSCFCCARKKLQTTF